MSPKNPNTGGRMAFAFSPVFASYNSSIPRKSKCLLVVGYSCSGANEIHNPLDQPMGHAWVRVEKKIMVRMGSGQKQHNGYVMGGWVKKYGKKWLHNIYMNNAQVFQGHVLKLVPA